MSGFLALFLTSPQEPIRVAAPPAAASVAAKREEERQQIVIDRQEEEELARPIAKKIGQLLTGGKRQPPKKPRVKKSVEQKGIKKNSKNKKPKAQVKKPAPKNDRKPAATSGGRA